MITQWAWRSQDGIEQSGWRLTKTEAEALLTRRGQGQIVERRVPGCATCGETRAALRNGRCGDWPDSSHNWRDSSTESLAAELAGMPEGDRRVAERVSALPEIEPAPGWEQRVLPTSDAPEVA